jgi:hypothetical protein
MGRRTPLIPTKRLPNPGTMNAITRQISAKTMPKATRKPTAVGSTRRSRAYQGIWNGPAKIATSASGT